LVALIEERYPGAFGVEDSSEVSVVDEPGGGDHRPSATASRHGPPPERVELAGEDEARLQALTDETRTRLFAFLTTGLQALSTEVEGGQKDDSKLALGDFQNTLQRQLPPSSVQAPERLAGIERPER